MFNQKRIDSIPVSYNYKSKGMKLTNVKYIKTLSMPKVNVDSLESYERKLNSLGIGRPFRFGYAFDVKYNMQDVGTWDTLENNNLLWRLKIICKDAYSINLIYSKFHLSKNALFYLYNNNDHLLGAFTNLNNKNHEKFATDLVKGDTTILEMYIPKNEVDQNQLVISKIVHGYKDLFKTEKQILKEYYKDQNITQNTDCDDDANCPEGDDWCREKYSVSRILVGGSHLCTGSLLNNTENDYTPFYLTAKHCVDGYDPDVWVFQFGYMYHSCGGGYTRPTYSYSGADLKAQWDNTDFALLKLQEQPQSGENNFGDVYFNGWDISGNIPNNTTGLHHRGGERLKISIDNDNPVSYTNFWNTTIDFGWIYYGSSGSPLYMPDKLVIGQASTAVITDECVTPQEVNYGKFSVSWTGGGTSQTRLKDWLDPNDKLGSSDSWDGIKMPNLLYGWIITDGQSWQRNAYDVFKVGSSVTSPFIVRNGGELNLKAGREIHIRPCSHIEAGSEFHAYIEELSCDDLVMLSDKESDYDAYNCGTSPPKISDFEQEIVTKGENYDLKIVPNPFNNQTTITVSLSSENNITLAIYDALGNKIHEFAKNKMFSAGEHNFTFRANNLQSGMFYVNLIGDDFRLSKPIMLMK